MKNKAISAVSLRLIVGLIFVLSSAVTQATVITQTNNFYFSGGPFNGNGGETIVNSGEFMATVSPFDTSLGTLLSFTQVWNLAFIGSFNVPDSNTEGSASLSVGGEFKIGG